MRREKLPRWIQNYFGNEIKMFLLIGSEEQKYILCYNDKASLLPRLVI